MARGDGSQRIRLEVRRAARSRPVAEELSSTFAAVFVRVLGLTNRDHSGVGGTVRDIIGLNLDRLARGALVAGEETVRCFGEETIAENRHGTTVALDSGGPPQASGCSAPVVAQVRGHRCVPPVARRWRCLLGQLTRDGCAVGHDHHVADPGDGLPRSAHGLGELSGQSVRCWGAWAWPSVGGV